MNSHEEKTSDGKGRSGLHAWGRQLAFAFRFFTRFPLPVSVKLSPGDIACSIVWFPIVGIFEGLFIGLITYFANLTESVYLAALICVAAHALISRGQINGLGHAIDGLFSSRDRNRMIEIMLDDKYGTMGVVAIAMDHILKFSLYVHFLTVLPYTDGVLKLLIASCIAGKLAMVIGISTSRSVYRRDRLIDDSRWYHVLFSALISFGIVFLLQDFKMLLAFFALELSLGSLISNLIILKLGGLTKQTLGVIHEVGEIVFLLIWASI